jgi:hypothetical protein
MKKSGIGAVAATWLVVAVLGAQGCGSDNNGGSPTPGNDAGVDATGDDAGDDADAGPSIEQDPNVYPSMHHPMPQLTNQGGPVLTAPKVVTVTWVGDPNRDKRRAFDDAIVANSWWQQTMSGYGVGNGSSGGYVELVNNFGATATLADADIQQLVQDNVASGAFPAPTAQTIYALYFPDGVSITNGSGSSCTTFGGYHEHVVVNAPSDGGTFDVAYAVIPHCKYPTDATQNFVQDMVNASHELAEAASDPLVGLQPAFVLTTNYAWVPDAYAGGVPENGDMCNDLVDYFTEGSYTMQRIWSNSAAAADNNPCVPAPAGRIFYAAAVRTQKIGAVDGYVVLSRGKSVDVVADVFSKAALPHDLKLLTGLVDHGFTNGNIMLPLTNGIKVDLSNTTVHNGNGVILTISAPANATTGDFKVVLRALLESNDYNDWPIFVRIK